MFYKHLLVTSIPEPTEGKMFRDVTGITPEGDWDAIWGFFYWPKFNRNRVFKWATSGFWTPAYNSAGPRNIKLLLCSLPSDHIQNNSLSWCRDKRSLHRIRSQKNKFLNWFSVTMVCSFNLCDFNFSLCRMQTTLTYLRVILQHVTFTKKFAYPGMEIVLQKLKL